MPPCCRSSQNKINIPST